MPKNSTQPIPFTARSASTLLAVLAAALLPVLLSNNPRLQTCVCSGSSASAAGSWQWPGRTAGTRGHHTLPASYQRLAQLQFCPEPDVYFLLEKESKELGSTSLLSGLLTAFPLQQSQNCSTPWDNEGLRSPHPMLTSTQCQHCLAPAGH